MNKSGLAGSLIAVFTLASSSLMPDVALASPARLFDKTPPQTVNTEFANQNCINRLYKKMVMDTAPYDPSMSQEKLQAEVYDTRVIDPTLYPETYEKAGKACGNLTEPRL